MAHELDVPESEVVEVLETYAPREKGAPEHVGRDEAGGALGGPWVAESAE